MDHHLSSLSVEGWSLRCAICLGKAENRSLLLFLTLVTTRVNSVKKAVLKYKPPIYYSCFIFKKEKLLFEFPYVHLEREATETTLQSLPLASVENKEPINFDQRDEHIGFAWNDMRKWFSFNPCHQFFWIRCMNWQRQ